MKQFVKDNKAAADKTVMILSTCAPGCDINPVIDIEFMDLLDAMGVGYKQATGWYNGRHIPTYVISVGERQSLFLKLAFYTLLQDAVLIRRTSGVYLMTNDGKGQRVGDNMKAVHKHRAIGRGAYTKVDNNYFIVA